MTIEEVKQYLKEEIEFCNKMFEIGKDGVGERYYSRFALACSLLNFIENDEKGY